MKNVIIINSYANTLERKNILFNCIKQIKKLNIDIILISNYNDEYDIKKLVDHYLYDSDNFLLPKEKSPLNWFADSTETIHLYHTGNSYIVYKHMCLSISFAKNLGYHNFLYLEFDCLFSDNDLFTINLIFDKYLSEKKMWMCNFFHYGKQAVESRLFAGNTTFFLENFVKITNLDMWYNTYPFSSSSETLEFIFDILTYNIRDFIYFTNKPVCDFFETSKFDLTRSFSLINIAFNNEIKEEPILFIITKTGTYEILIDNKSILKNEYTEFNIIKYKFKISTHLTNIKVLLNNSTIYEDNISLDNIENFKDNCVRYKL